MTDLAPSSSSKSLEGRLLSGKYQVESLLGEGGMGAVYVAVHAITKRRGALKLLHARFAAVPHIVERFIKEASAAGVIGSPHIVETYDAGRLESGEPYIFMELLSGKPIEELLRGRTFEVAEALQIIVQAAEGLAAAHHAGIVHRDVKPGNLFVLDGQPPFVKVLDFGVSKFTPDADAREQHKTQEGSLLGTPLYMPPEQVMGHKDVDARADVYALGAVLYEMLAGTPPFTGDSLMQLSANICSGEYTPLRQLRDDVSPSLQHLVDRALAADRTERFADAAALSGALQDGFQVRIPSRVSSWPSAPLPGATLRPMDGRESASSSESQQLPAAEVDNPALVATLLRLSASTVDPVSSMVSRGETPIADEELPLSISAFTRRQPLWIWALSAVTVAMFLLVLFNTLFNTVVPDSGKPVSSDDLLPTAAAIPSALPHPAPSTVVTAVGPMHLPQTGSGAAMNRPVRPAAVPSISTSSHATASADRHGTERLSGGEPHKLAPAATTLPAVEDGLTLDNPFGP